MIDISESELTLTEVLKVAKPYDVIYLGGRTFNEKVYVRTPHITLIGDDATITYNAYHSLVIPESEGGNGVKTYGTTGSATFTVKEGADYFKAEGIKFINSHIKVGNKGQQAVAFKSEASHIRLERCAFVSEQDTLYLDRGENILIYDCFIYGDVDFIFGSAKADINSCVIEAINDGYICAPSTYTYHEYGLKFNNCLFKVNGDKKVYLGRPWYPEGDLNKTRRPSAIFNKCVFSSNISLRFIRMHEIDPKDRHELIINNCIYKGSTISYFKTE